jgi:hypothetical protein
MKNKTSKTKKSRPLTKHNVNGWVAVSEQLPKEGVAILATNGKRVYYDVTLQYKDEFWIHFFGYDNDSWKIEDVTHWMALPEPPCR